MSILIGRTTPAAPTVHAPAPLAPRLSFVWVALFVASVFYGSLLPFDFDWTMFTRQSVFGLASLSLHNVPLEDVLTNIAVYIPIGLAMVLCGNRRRGARLFRIPLALVVGACVSFISESLQAGIAARVASWMDVALNIFGTGVGALLGVGLYSVAKMSLNRLHYGLRHYPFKTLASILTVGLLLYGLAPFDFVTDTAGLHASFLRARWDLLTVRGAAPGQPPFALVTKQISGAAWFAALGFLLALASREGKRPPLVAFGSALKHGIILAVIVECVQLFTTSHVFDLAALMLRALAVSLAAWCAVFVIGRPLFWGSGDHAGARSETLLIAGLALFQMTLIVLSVAHVNLSFPHGIEWASVHWIPFESLWHQAATRAAVDILSTVLTFAALTVTLVIVFRRLRITTVWVPASLVVISLALVVEGFRLLSLTQAADATEPILALIAVMSVASVYAVFRPMPRGNQPLVPV